MKKLPLSYYSHTDVVSLARDLIGKKLCTKIDDCLTTGIITETEAYHHSEKACHAHLGRRTKRTEVMFGPGGHAYVYLCYGIHHLFNIVTGNEGEAEAILIRAIEPVEGTETMLERRGRVKLEKTLCSGPGTLTQALGIRTIHTREALSGDLIWLEEGMKVNLNEIETATRIGVDYAAEDALLPWRFYLITSRFVSRR